MPFSSFHLTAKKLSISLSDRRHIDTPTDPVPAHSVTFVFKILSKFMITNFTCTCVCVCVIGVSVSEPHLRRPTCPLSVCLSVYIVRPAFLVPQRPPRTCKHKPAHLKFKSHMRWRYGYVANASLAITTSVFTVKIALVTTVFTVYHGK